MAKKTWKYHTSLSFKHEGKEQTVATQLYQIGIYAIFNNNPSLQSAFKSPEPLIKMEKGLTNDVKLGKITDLVFGTEITVTTDADGFLVKV